MEKKAFVEELVRLADVLDEKGLTQEANELDSIVKEAEGIFTMTPYSSPGTEQSRYLQRREERREEDKKAELIKALENKTEPLSEEKMQKMLAILAE